MVLRKLFIFSLAKYLECFLLFLISMTHVETIVSAYSKNSDGLPYWRVLLYSNAIIADAQ